MGYIMTLGVKYEQWMMACWELDEVASKNEKTMELVAGVFAFQTLLKISFSGSDTDGFLYWEVSKWLWGFLKARMISEIEICGVAKVMNMQSGCIFSPSQTMPQCCIPGKSPLIHSPEMAPNDVLDSRDNLWLLWDQCLEHIDLTCLWHFFNERRHHI